MNGSRSSEPPEEPFLRSEPSVLSPASPKPFHFPQPTNIPILEMQMDVDFNQTEVHMSDPATRNTELRPDAWRDPSDLAVDATSNDPPDPKAENTSHVTDAVNEVPFSEPFATSEDASKLTGPDETFTEQVTGSDGLDDNATPANGDPAPNGATSVQLPLSEPVVSAATHESQLNPSPAHPNVEPMQSSTDGSADVRSLLDNLESSLTSETAPANSAPLVEGVTVPTTSFQADSDSPVSVLDNTAVSAPGLSAPPSGLPPRPPPQEQPNIHPNYMHSQHIRDYHPHASNPAFQHHTRNNSSGNAAELNTTLVPPASASSVQHGASPIVNAGELQESPTSTFAAQSIVPHTPLGNLPHSPATFGANTPIESRREAKLAAGETPGVDDMPWTPETQRKYDNFLEEERKYVNEARWDQFPNGSRLFVGNLSSEKVTKRDIFHVFHSYGELAQISIKQAYGFVQFLNVDDCQRAMDGQQGRQIRDKRIHLEVSKPQKSKNTQQNANRRSRSPDYSRRSGGNADRYVGGSGSSGRRRDEYRGYRSPSPRGYRDRYDDRYRGRSRSPGYGRDDRYRTRSPPRDADDDLPLPRRLPGDVPDVQIIIQAELNRDFIAWVEGHFTAVGVRVGTLRLAPRLSEDAVVKRQIMEGVVAVVKLQRMNQETSKIGLKIFKRQPGVRDVHFEDYDNLDPSICAQLVLREKQSQPAPGGYATSQYSAPTPMPQYGYQTPSGPPPPATHQPPYGYPSGYGASAPAPTAPAYGAPQPLTNINTNNLQTLLTSLNQGSPGTPRTAASTSQYSAQPPLPGVAYPPPPSAGYGQYPGQSHAAPQNPYAHYPQPAGAPLQQQGQTSQTPNMQDILARLGTYGNR